MSRDETMRLFAVKCPPCWKTVVPTLYPHYAGTLNEQSMRIEIWPPPAAAGIQYITEFSMECGSLEEAAEIRKGIIDMLDEMGILLHEDALKAQLVLSGLDMPQE